MTTDNAINNFELISGINVWSFIWEVMKMIDYIFWFAFGFVLGFLFFIFMKLIKNYLYQRSKRLRRKAFREKMDNLMK